VVRADSPVVDFPGGYEEFVEGRRRASKQMVQSLMRKRRKMERELGELRFVLHSTRGEDLARLMEWKTGQYRAMGEWDRFGDPRITALLRDLQYAVGEQCTGTLSVLTAGGRPAAAHFGVRSRTTLSWWFPAYDPDLGRYSPGMQLLFLMVEAAADQGVRRINLGIGAHEYKDAVRTGAVVVGRGLVDDGSTTAVLHRLRRAPRHHLRPLVVGNPRLHALARRLMRPRGVSGPR
jgi:CelD/BcsL family acetyltransferase involved in cellulose biosynthesis